MPLRIARPTKRPRASSMATTMPAGRLPSIAQDETTRLSRMADSSSGLSLSQSISGQDDEALLREQGLGRGRLDVVEEHGGIGVRRGGDQGNRVDDRRVSLFREGG